MERNQDRWWDGLLCGCLVVLAVLVTFPFAEMGFSDDFSYIKTAYDYARTGHLIYNGWAAPMLGWQAVWGALFIKIFGFSFSAVRWSTLPVALITIWLFFAVLIGFGISRRNAYFGALLFGLSPIFIPLATSFMTDISSEFILILCIYLCQRAIKAKTDATTIGWLSLAAASNVAGGTVRQIAWLGVLVIVPSTAWLLRKRRGVLPVGVALWCLSAACIFGCVHWLNHQPYSLPEEILPKTTFTVSFMVGRIGIDLIKDFLCLSLLVLPLLLAWMQRMKRFRPATLALILVLTCAFQASSLKTGRGYHLLPWMHSFIVDLGVGPTFTWALGFPPAILNNATKYLLSYIIMVVAVAFVIDLFRGRKIAVKTSITTWLKADALSESSREFWILVPFTVVYLLLLLPRSVVSEILDRYLFGLLPVVIIWVLKLYQNRFSQPLPIVSYVILAVLAVYSIGGTHDWYALNRARMQAASTLLESGVPDTKMLLGLDYDSWTQYKYFPAIAAPHARVPDWFYSSARPPRLPDDCVFWSWKMTPSLNPNYFVVLSPMPCLAPSRFAPITYHAWLPPFHRIIYIQQRP